MNFQDYILFLFGAFAKFRKKNIFSFVVSVHPSVCPNGTNRLQLDGFSLNLIFVYTEWQKRTHVFEMGSTSERYVEMLRNFLRPQLRSLRVNMEEM